MKILAWNLNHSPLNGAEAHCSKHKSQPRSLISLLFSETQYIKLSVKRLNDSEAWCRLNSLSCFWLFFGCHSQIVAFFPFILLNCDPHVGSMRENWNLFWKSNISTLVLCQVNDTSPSELIRVSLYLAQGHCSTIHTDRGTCCDPHHHTCFWLLVTSQHRTWLIKLQHKKPLPCPTQATVHLNHCSL